MASFKGLKGRCFPSIFSAWALFLLTACEPATVGRDAGGYRADGTVLPSDCTAQYGVARRRPEVFVVLDRSCSMRETFAGGAASGPEDPNGRWNATRAQLLSLVSRASVSGLGLMFVPDDPRSCDALSPRIVPGPGSAMAVEELLTSRDPIDPFALCASGSTEYPLGRALESLVSADPFASEDPLVLLITSGAPSCGATREGLADGVAMLTELGVDVVILALSSEPTTLDLASLAGPRARQFSVTTSAALESALQSIMAERASCVLELVGGPSSPESTGLRVFVDDVEVMADPEHGFSFDVGADALTLNGALCDRLLAREITRVQVAVGCDDPVCIPRVEACDDLDDDCDDRVDEECS